MKTNFSTVDKIKDILVNYGFDDCEGIQSKKELVEGLGTCSVNEIFDFIFDLQKIVGEINNVLKETEKEEMADKS